MLRRLFLTVATIALAAMTMAGVTGTAGGETASRSAAALAGPVLLENENDLCMDLRSNASGTVVTMAGCNDNLLSQYWYFFNDRTIENENFLCMDLRSNAAGAPVVMAPCQAGYTSQKWYVEGQMISNYNGLCMDLGSNAVGAPVIMAACRPDYTSQTWYGNPPS